MTLKWKDGPECTPECEEMWPFVLHTPECPRYKWILEKLGPKFDGFEGMQTS